MAGCLKFYHETVQRTAAVPSRGSYPSVQTWTTAMIMTDFFSARGGEQPVKKPFPIHDLGPPTWVEEQRVLRAFWRMQLFHDLERAAANGSIPYLSTELAKSEDSIKTLMALHCYRRPDEPSSCRLMDASPARRQRLHEERMHVLGLDTGEIGMEVGYPDEFNNGCTAADFDNSRMPPELQVENWSGYPHQVNRSHSLKTSYSGQC